MKKLKIIIFTFLSWILIGISLPKPVYCTENINSISLFSGDASASVSNVAATIINPKNFRCIDTDVMNKDGYFYAKYTGDKEAIRLVFESSYGGEEWVTITPSETGNTEDGCYYAKFNDETLKSYYKSDYANIDKIHIWAVNGKIALKSLQYVVQGREDNQLIENTYLPTETNVKSLGRTYFYNNALWCALSGSGAEYTFNGTKCEVTILGDNVSQWGAEGLYSRVAIYVNGERVIDTLISDKEKTFNVFESEEPEDVDVRIVKLSESAYSTIGIKNIKVTSIDGIKPVENKEHTIEFIGDSITCGYGVDDEDPNHHFSTATEDVTKTYAYKCAEALNADYSFVSYSGYGVISGCTTTGNKEEDDVIFNVYNKVGKSYGSFNGEIDPSSIEWNFEKIRPDIIVINLGTNDSSYCGEDMERHSEFKDGYINLLKMVREKNPKADIICTVGILGGKIIYQDIEEAAADYIKETGDDRISCMEFDFTLFYDGMAADYHPREITHEKSAKKLIYEIEKLI